MTKFNLVRPCDNCPFRADKPFYLGEGRAQEIAESLRAGGEFYCHKTTNDERLEDYDDSGFYNPSGEESFCAGALIVLENSDGPNQMMRISERLGFYDMSKLDLGSPVYDSLDEFEEAMEGNI